MYNLLYHSKCPISRRQLMNKQFVFFLTKLISSFANTLSSTSSLQQLYHSSRSWFVEFRCFSFIFRLVVLYDTAAMSYWLGKIRHREKEHLRGHLLLYFFPTFPHWNRYFGRRTHERVRNRFFSCKLAKTNRTDLPAKAKLIDWA